MSRRKKVLNKTKSLQPWWRLRVTKLWHNSMLFGHVGVLTRCTDNATVQMLDRCDVYLLQHLSLVCDIYLLAPNIKQSIQWLLRSFTKGQKV